MGITSGIMSIFGSGSNSPAPTPNPTQTPTPSTQEPAQQATPTEPTVTDTPAEPSLDNFKELWQQPKEGEVPATFDPANIFSIDHEQVNKQVSAMNFTTGISQAHIDRIAAGGEDAIKANLEVINNVAQNVFKQAMFASAELTKGAITTVDKHLDSRIDGRARTLQVSNSLREANPALNHPAAAPIIKALETQFAVKYPNATPTELTKLAQDYLVSFSGQVAGKKEPAQSETGEMDWSSFG